MLRMDSSRTTVRCAMGLPVAVRLPWSATRMSDISSGAVASTICCPDASIARGTCRIVCATYGAVPLARALTSIDCAVLRSKQNRDQQGTHVPPRNRGIPG